MWHYYDERRDNRSDGERVNKSKQEEERVRRGLHWIFMLEGLCRCLIFNMVLWFIIPRQWTSAVSALCCCAASVASCCCCCCCCSTSASGGLLWEREHFPGRYYFHKKITHPVFLSACRPVLWIWAGMACHYNNITSALTALRRCALQRGRESGKWKL